MADAVVRPISWSVGVGMVVVVPVLANAIGGLGLGHALAGELEFFAARWDSRYDPIVVRGGEVSAGPRIVHETDGWQTLLVDPEEQIARSAITTREAVIVRRTTIERVRPLQHETYAVQEVMDAFGLEELILDSAHLRSWLSVHRGQVVLGTVVVCAALGAVDWVLMSLYALLAALLVVRRSQGAWGLSVVYPAALALTAPVVILRWSLWGVGFPVGCAGPLVWPAVLTGLTAALLAQWSRPEDEPEA